MYEYYYRMFDDGSFCLVRGIGKGDTAIIPNNRNISIIFDDIFKGHTELTHVEFPDTVTEIGGFVFDGCINLKEITLPPNLKNLWQYAMARCGIEVIEIPGSVKSITPYTFNQCKQLKTVTLNEGTERIHAWAFKDCISLIDIFLPSSLTEISDKAFEGCGEVKLHYKY